jgi:hypothetical protein
MLARMTSFDQLPHAGDLPSISARLKLLRSQAYVVNTARGEVIDENALIRMIAAGELAGAGLDVFEHEPAVNPRLARLAREGKVVLLPHMGSATIEGRIDMGEKVIVNIRTFMDGHKPPDKSFRRCCEPVKLPLPLHPPLERRSEPPSAQRRRAAGWVSTKRNKVPPTPPPLRSGGRPPIQEGDEMLRRLPQWFARHSMPAIVSHCHVGARSGAR